MSIIINLLSSTYLTYNEYKKLKTIHVKSTVWRENYYLQTNALNF